MCALSATPCCVSVATRLAAIAALALFACVAAAAASEPRLSSQSSAAAAPLVLADSPAAASFRPANNASAVRAVWIPTQFYAELTAADVATLASMGVNRIYADVWNNGRVWFRSPTMARIAPSGTAEDALSTVLRLAAPHNIEVIPWLEYGNMACYGSPGGSGTFSGYAQAQGWLLGNHGGFEWMDPSNQAVIDFLGAIIGDIFANYRVPAVQLDDHFACPPVFSRCSRSAMNTAAANLFKQVTRVGRMVLAPAPIDFSLRSLNVDWVYMMNKGYFGEAAVQLYYPSASTFSGELRYELGKVGSSIAKRYIAGIRVDGSGSPTSWTNVQQMLVTSADYGVGVSIWYCRGVLRLYADQFRQWWG